MTPHVQGEPAAVPAPYRGGVVGPGMDALDPSVPLWRLHGTATPHDREDAPVFRALVREWRMRGLSVPGEEGGPQRHGALRPALGLGPLDGGPVSALPAFESQLPRPGTRLPAGATVTGHALVSLVQADRRGQSLTPSPVPG